MFHNIKYIYVHNYSVFVYLCVSRVLNMMLGDSLFTEPYQLTVTFIVTTNSVLV